MTEKIIFSLLLACGVVWIASATPRNDGAVAVDCFASQSDVRNDGGQVVVRNATAEKNWCGVYEYAFTLGDMKVNDTNAVQKVLKEQFAVQVAEAKAAGIEKEYLAYPSDDLVVKGMKHQLKFVADHGVAFFVKAKQAQPLTAEEQSVGEAYSAFAKPLYIAIEMSHPKHREIADLEKAIAQKHGSFVTQLIAAKALSGTFLLKAKALND